MIFNKWRIYENCSVNSKPAITANNIGVHKFELFIFS